MQIWTKNTVVVCNETDILYQFILDIGQKFRNINEEEAVW